MLYDIYEWQHAALSPWGAAARANIALFSSPFGSWHPMRREIVAGSDVMLRLIRRYEKPVFGLNKTVIDSEVVTVHEEVAETRPFCRLLHFRRETTRDSPRVLLVAPLSGHHSTLLRDTVKTMLPDCDVYITDWTDARLVPASAGTFGLADYVEYVRHYIQLLGPEVNVVAVCQPAVPVMAAVSLMNEENDPHTPRTMVLMGGPIDTRRGPTSVNTFAQHHSIEWFEQHVIQRVPWPHAGHGRRVYPGFLQHACFLAMNAERHYKAYRGYFDHLVQGDESGAAAHRRFYDEYNAVLDLSAEFYLETVRAVFQEHALPRGKMNVRGQAVRPELITRTALMTIEGERDDITGMGQTEAAQDLCSGLPAEKRQHLLAEGVGHYGIFNGRRFRSHIYPEVLGFIRRHG